MAKTFIKIASVSVGAGGTTSIQFTSIPQTFTDLVVKASIRGTAALDYESVLIAFNGVFGSFREMYGTNTTVGAGTAAQNRIGYASASNNTANTFGNGEIYIPNYTSTNIKAASADGVSENNGAVTVLSLTANQNPTTSPITSLTVTALNGNIAQYSTASLYGIKNS